MYCRSCHYNLRRLRSTGCPECGTLFDPTDPDTYIQRKPPVIRMRWLVLMAFATGWGVVLVAVSLDPYAYGPPGIRHYLDWPARVFITALYGSMLGAVLCIVTVVIASIVQAIRAESE